MRPKLIAKHENYSHGGEEEGEIRGTRNLVNIIVELFNGNPDRTDDLNLNRRVLCG